MHLRSAKAQLQNRFGASVAEVDHHDVWQRARLTLAFVDAGAPRGGAAARRRRALPGSREWELALVEREVVSLDEA